MTELKIISAISCHKNIVNLIGACTSGDGTYGQYNTYRYDEINYR